MTGPLFGRYRLLGKPLGQGGFGVVYAAVDVEKDREVAVKIFQPTQLPEHLIPQFEERFQRESEVVARLRHPHIVGIHNYGKIGEQLFIEMERVAGPSLRALLPEEGLPPDRAISLVSQVAKALRAAHRAGLVHRDVNPSNILVEDDHGDDHAYLIDFGICQVTGLSRLTTVPFGTRGYVPPEMLGHDSDHRVDVYALGAVLYEAVTGKQAFHVEDFGPLAIATPLWMRATPPSLVRPDLPKALDEVVLRALATDPGDRFADMSEFLEALRGVSLADEPPAPSTRPSAPRQPTRIPPTRIDDDLTDPGVAPPPRRSLADVLRPLGEALGLLGSAAATAVGVFLVALVPVGVVWGVINLGWRLIWSIATIPTEPFLIDCGFFSDECQSLPFRDQSYPRDLDNFTHPPDLLTFLIVLGVLAGIAGLVGAVRHIMDEW